MAMIMQRNPQLWGIMGDLYVKSSDWPGADKLADRLHKALPPQLQEADDTPLPPQAKQAIDTLMQQNEQLTQALHAAHDELDSKHMEIDSKEKIAAMDNETKIVVEEMRNNFGVFSEEVKHLTALLKNKIEPEISATPPLS